MSPTEKSSRWEASTRQTVPPPMTSPISTGGAYDGPAFIRPRM